MASAWNASFGTAWGNSWGSTAVVTRGGTGLPLKRRKRTIREIVAEVLDEIAHQSGGVVTPEATIAIRTAIRREIYERDVVTDTSRIDRAAHIAAERIIQRLIEDEEVAAVLLLS